MEGYGHQSDDISFNFIFHDGYSFRHLVEYFKILGVNTKMLISANGIYMSVSTPNNKVLNIISIYKHELPKYEFSSSRQSVCISLDSKTFYDHGLKPIKKTKVLRIYKYAGQPYVQVQCLDHIEGSNNDDGIQIPIITENEQTRIYGQPEIDYKNPIITKPTNTLIEGLAHVKTCDAVIFLTSSHGILARGIQNGILKTTKSFGDYNHDEATNTHFSQHQYPAIEFDVSSIDFSSINVSQSQEIVTVSPATNNNSDGVKTSKQFIAAFSKLKNVSQNSTVKFYAEKIVNDNHMIEYKYIAIVFSIGSYGELRIFIR